MTIPLTTSKPTTEPMTNSIGCKHDGKQYRVGQEFRKGCEQKCKCNLKHGLAEAVCFPYCGFVFPPFCPNGQPPVMEKGPADSNNCRCDLYKCKGGKTPLQTMLPLSEVPTTQHQGDKTPLQTMVLPSEVPTTQHQGDCSYRGKKYKFGDTFKHPCSESCECNEYYGLRCNDYCWPVAMPMCHVGQEVVSVLGPADSNGCRCKIYKCAGTPKPPTRITLQKTTKEPTTQLLTMLFGCKHDGKLYNVGQGFRKGCEEWCTCKNEHGDAKAFCLPYCGLVFPRLCPNGQLEVSEKGPADSNNCRCDLYKCEAPSGCKSNNRTTGGTARGSCCVFPFKYKGKLHNKCTDEDHDRSWCYTENGKWGNCPAPTGCKSNYKTSGGPAKGSCCVFPFKYKGKVYHKCTMKDARKTWCYTENNHKWGYC